MHLIEAYPIPTPADAERLIADLWQLTSGRSIGLFLFGLRGDQVVLGVHCAHPYVEDIAASTIADHCGGQVEPGWVITQMVDVADDIALVNLVPTERNLALASSTFGWQRTDPLRGVYNTLANLSSDTLAGVGLTLRSMPNLQFMTTMSAFAIGPGAGPSAVRLASSFGGIGVRLRRPFRQKRAVLRTLDAQIRRPTSALRVEMVSLYWHPPYGQDAPMAGHLESSQPAPAGLLHGS